MYKNYSQKYYDWKIIKKKNIELWVSLQIRFITICQVHYLNTGLYFEYTYLYNGLN